MPLILRWNESTSIIVGNGFGGPMYGGAHDMVCVCLVLFMPSGALKILRLGRLWSWPIVSFVREFCWFVVKGWEQEKG